MEAFNQKNLIQNKLKTEFGIEGELNQRMTYQMVLKQAETGHTMTEEQILDLKTTLSFFSPLKTNQTTYKPYLEQKALSLVLETNNSIQFKKESFSHRFEKEMVKTNQQLTDIVKQDQLIQTNIQQEVTTMHKSQ